MMAAFYNREAELETDKQRSGGLVLKAGQFEDSVEFEEKFLVFIQNEYRA